MSILIKSMDMPEHCYECLLRQGNCCLLLYEAVPPTVPLKRLADCPLVEIPTPHGRLIDDVKKIIAQIEPCMLIATTYDEQVKRAEAVKEWLLSILEAEGR